MRIRIVISFIIVSAMVGISHKSLFIGISIGALFSTGVCLVTSIYDAIGHAFEDTKKYK